MGSSALKGVVLQYFTVAWGTCVSAKRTLKMPWHSAPGSSRAKQGCKPHSSKVT